ncbi:MAG: hypothetical protein ACTSYR_02180 [Candidatus Odinarchaeia archaeon]
MITQTIINRLNSDSTLLNLLDSSTSEEVKPIFGGFLSEDLLSNYDKFIIVTFEYGASDYVDRFVQKGTVIVEINVKESVQEPIKSLNELANRVLQLLDLKGDSINDQYVDDVYMVRKTDSVLAYNLDTKSYGLSLMFDCTYRLKES